MIILLFFLLPLTSACPEACKCGEGRVECEVPSTRDFPKLGWPENTTVLDLSGNNILNFPPDSLRNLPNLEELILDGNKLYFLENGAFKELPNLKKLSIQSNNLHFIEADAFSDLTQLEELYLAENSIDELPNIRKNTKLKKFCVSRNNIEIIPENAFKNNTQLTELKLTGNKLTSLPRHAFPDDVTSFTVLSLVGNSFRDIPDVVKEMRNLQKLSLCHNPLKVFEAQEFLPFKNIKMLSMTNIGLTEIAENVFKMATLEELYLGGNSIEAGSLSNLALPELKTLVLKGNPLKVLTGSPFIHLPKLETLDLSECDISWVIQQSLKYLSDLRELDLRSNGLSEIPNFEHSTNLESLDLGDNNVTLVSPEPFRILRIKKLSLANNSLQDLDANFSEDAFSGLTSLDLSHNQLLRLPDVVMTSMHNLVSLNISHNGISDVNGSWFENLPKLKTLNLKGNNLTTFPNETFAYLANLNQLYLCQNQLKDLNPLALSRLPNLQEFTADKNKLKEIDENVFASNLHLNKISLNHNQLRHIRKRTFYNLHKLRELWLLYNGLTESPKFDHNINLRVLGLCGNPLGNLPQAALNGPRGLEVLLLRDVGLTEFSPHILAYPGKIKYLNLASGNYLTSVPVAIKQMTSLEVLKLTGNPITTICSSNFAGLNHLKEIRLDNMKLTSFDVTTLFLTSPALRTLHLGSNPWRCDCDMERFALGNDGKRAKVDIGDRHLMACSSPHRYKDKRIDFLRLEDFRQCAASSVKRVMATSACLDLPAISSIALDHPDVHHRIAYQPLGGGREKIMTVGGDQRVATIDGLTSNTKYIVCVKTVTSASKSPEGPRGEEKEMCHKVVTKSTNDQAIDAEANGNTGASTDILTVIYSVIVAVVGVAMIATIVSVTVWCRRVGIKRHNHFANISSESDQIKDGESAAESPTLGQQSINGVAKQPSACHKQSSDVMLISNSNSSHVNEAYDVMKVRTKV